MPTVLLRERIAEDDEAADDAGDVGGGAGDRDHRNGLTVLQALAEA